MWRPHVAVGRLSDREVDSPKWQVSATEPEVILQKEAFGSCVILGRFQADRVAPCNATSSMIWGCWALKGPCILASHGR